MIQSTLNINGGYHQLLIIHFLISMSKKNEQLWEKMEEVLFIDSEDFVSHIFGATNVINI